MMSKPLVLGNSLSCLLGTLAGLAGFVGCSSSTDDPKGGGDPTISHQCEDGELLLEPDGLLEFALDETDIYFIDYTGTVYVSDVYFGKLSKSGGEPETIATVDILGLDESGTPIQEDIREDTTLHHSVRNLLVDDADDYLYFHADRYFWRVSKQGGDFQAVNAEPLAEDSYPCTHSFIAMDAEALFSCRGNTVSRLPRGQGGALTTLYEGVNVRSLAVAGDSVYVGEVDLDEGSALVAIEKTGGGFRTIELDEMIPDRLFSTSDVLVIDAPFTGTYRMDLRDDSFEQIYNLQLDDWPAVAVDDSFVYTKWNDGQGSNHIIRFPTGGGEVERFVDCTHSEGSTYWDMRNMQVDENWLYVVFSDYSLRRFPLR